MSVYEIANSKFMLWIFDIAKLLRNGILESGRMNLNFVCRIVKVQKKLLILNIAF